MGMIAPNLTEILQLTVAERIQLVEDIWDSIVAVPENLDLTEPQRQELSRRLANYRPRMFSCPSRPETMASAHVALPGRSFLQNSHFFHKIRHLTD